MKPSRLLALALAVVGAAGAGQDTTHATPSFEQLIEAAQQAQRQNDLRSAALRYAEALKLRPDIPELHANLGVLEYQLGNASAAAREFHTAMRAKPSLFVPNLFLGIEYLKQNNASGALPYLTRAAQMNPGDPEVNLSLGRAYAALDKDTDAIAAYSNAVAIQSNNEDGWYGLGTSYLSRAESLAALFAKRYRDSAAFRALTANYFDEQGKYDRAIAEHRTIGASSDAPACSQAWFGFALLHGGQVSPAEEQFNAALGAPDCRTLARIGLARGDMEAGKTAAASAMLTQAEEQEPEEFRANAFEFWKDLPPEKARAFEQALNAEAPGEDLKAALKGASSGDLPRTYLSGHYRSTALLGEKAIAAGNAGSDVLYWTIRADQRMGVIALSQAVAVAPRSIRIHLLLGDLYRRKGQYPAAQREFQDALKLDGSSVPALLGLATTLYLNGDFASAEHQAVQLLASKPDDPESKLLMAEILLDQRRYTDAYKYVEPVPAGKPDFLAEVHGLRGKIFAATNRPQEAIAELKQALNNDPQGDFTYVLARQYQILGAKQLADAAFQRSKMLRQNFNERASYKFEGGAQN